MVTDIFLIPKLRIKAFKVYRKVIKYFKFNFMSIKYFCNFCFIKQ